MADTPSLWMFGFGVALAYGYAFISGFTDAANAIATSIGTRAFTPTQAVLLAGVFELIGALSGTAVALTIGGGILTREASSPGVVAAALFGAMSWSLITFLRGIPVSETHGLIGGIVGAGIAGHGLSVVEWAHLVPILLAMVLSPALGFVGAVLLLSLISRVFVRMSRSRAIPLFRNLQRVSALYMAFSHGRNDAQKPMGVMAMTLATTFSWPTVYVPTWVIVSIAATAALGVASGGWRIIRTLGSRVTPLDTVQGFAAEASAASVLQLASSFGIPVSTTHAITSAIVGAGTLRGVRRVRWGIVGEIALSWIFTLPATVTLGFLYALLFRSIFG